MHVITTHYIPLPLVISGVHAGLAEDVEVRAEVDFTAAEPAWFDPMRGVGDPGCAADVDIVGLSVAGADPSNPTAGKVWREVALSDPMYDLIAAALAEHIDDVREQASDAYDEARAYRRRGRAA